MTVAYSDGSSYNSPLDLNLERTAEAFPNPFSDVNKYTPAAPSGKKEPLDPNPLKFWEHPSPTQRIPIRESSNDKDLPFIPPPFVPLQLPQSPPPGESLFQKGMNPPRKPKSEIDYDHHVPLLASAKMDGSGIYIDSRLKGKLSKEEEGLLQLHEGLEHAIMQHLTANGVPGPKAYDIAHPIATAGETEASKSLWGEEGHERYKDRMRQFAALTPEPSGKPIASDAHTTYHGLDKAEGVQVAMNDNISSHPSMLSPDLLGQQIERAHMHSGPMVMPRPANMNKPSKQLENPEAEARVQREWDEAVKSGEAPKTTEEPHIKGVYDNIKRQYEKEGLEAPPREFLELGAAKQAYPEMFKFYKAKLEQEGNTKELEKMKSFENWEQSLNITRDLVSGKKDKPSLKVIEGSKGVAPTFDRVKELLDQGKEGEARAFLDKQRAKDQGITVKKLRGNERPETIKSPAIKFSSGKVMEGKMHFDILQKGFDAGESAIDMVDGFTTSTGRFVDRAEASKIAKESGQVKSPMIKDFLTHGDLDTSQELPLDKYPPSEKLQHILHALKGEGMTVGEAKKFMEKHPGKTFEDAIKSVTGEEIDE